MSRDHKDPMLEGNQTLSEGGKRIKIDDAFRLKDNADDAWELIQDNVDCSQYSGSYPKNGPCMLFMLKEVQIYCEKHGLIEGMVNGNTIVDVIIHVDGSWGLSVAHKPTSTTGNNIMPVNIMPVIKSELQHAIERKYVAVKNMYGMDSVLPFKDSDPRTIKVNLSAVDAQTNGESVDEIIENLRRFSATPLKEGDEVFTVRLMFTNEIGDTNELEALGFTRELIESFTEHQTLN